MELLFGWMNRPDPGEERLSELFASRAAARAERDDAFNGMKSARIEATNGLTELRDEVGDTARRMREALGG